MYFKLDLTLRNIYLDKDLVEIDYGGVHRINVTLRYPTEEEQAIGHEKGNPFCIVAGEWTPRANLLGAFKSLAENKMPKGSKQTEEWHIHNIDQDGNIKVKMYVPKRLLPDPFVSFVEQVNQELNDYAKRIVNVLRWRCGTEGYHNPIGWRGAVWSFDGQNWEPMPSSGKAYGGLAPYIRHSAVCIHDFE